LPLGTLDNFWGTLHPKCCSTPPRESPGASNGAYHQKFILLFHSQQPVLDQYDWRLGIEGMAEPLGCPPVRLDTLWSENTCRPTRFTDPNGLARRYSVDSILCSSVRLVKRCVGSLDSGALPIWKTVSNDNIRS
jgi:hypothetical protein